MQRTTAGGDARLHDRYSIGVGGHLNPGDGGLLGGLRREWARGARRRLRARLPARRRCSTTTRPTVGAVHLGAVYVADAAGRPVAIRETDKLTGALRRRPTRWRAVADRLETWSRLVFEFLEASRSRAAVR